MLDYFVPGQPIPQGSKTAAVISGRAVMFDANKKLKSWRQAITMATNLELTRLRWTGYEPGDALVVFLHFHLERPKSVKRLEPTVKPDLDKLVRAVLDGITDARAWNDDSQVVAVYATKNYGVPGVEIRVYNKSVTNQDTLLKALQKSPQHD